MACLLRWSIKFPFVVKDHPHILHLKGFSPVWVQMWCLSVVLWEKAFWQVSHWNLLSLTILRFFFGSYSQFVFIWQPLYSNIKPVIFYPVISISFDLRGENVRFSLEISSCWLSSIGIFLSIFSYYKDTFYRGCPCLF